MSHVTSRWLLFVALPLGLFGCGEDASSQPADAHLTDTRSPDVLNDVQPDGAPDASSEVDTARVDANPEDGDATSPDVDTEPRDPFSYPDPTPPFLPAVEDPPPPTTCLPVVNAGAEIGDLSGWRVDEGSFSAASGYPVPYEGSYQFRAGKSASAKLSQTINLAAPTTAPQTALLRVMVRAESGDEAWLTLTALDAQSTPLATRRSGGYTEDEWHDGEIGLALPLGTARLRITLEGVRESILLKNNTFFDNVELCLYDRTPQGLSSDLPAPPYLMNVTPNGVTVVFEARAATPAEVLYGTDPARLDQRVASPTSQTLHKIRLTGLQPATRYYYRLRYADLELPPYDLLTTRAPDDDGRIEFIFLADNQDGPDVFRRLARDMAAWDPDFVLHGGDSVQNGTRWDYRNTFFAQAFGLTNRAPIVMAMGNHESYSSAILVSPASLALWDAYTDQPGDGHCFGWRTGSLFVVVLDTERSLKLGSPQYTCLEQILNSEAAQSATFRVALFHRPPLIEYWSPIGGEPATTTFFTFGMDAPDVRDFVAPLLEQKRVQLVFNGHNHLYQFVPRWPHFTAWVTAGGAGGGLEVASPTSRVNDWSEFIDTQIVGRFHFLRVIIEHRKLWVQVLGEGGAVLHAFQIDP